MLRTSRIAAQASLAAAALFLVVLIALHLLRRDLDPSWRFISEYELGDYGWLMRLAFCIWAASCLFLCAAVFRYSRSVVGWLAMFLIVLSVAGMLIAAIFVPDKDNKLHELGAMLDNIPFAALLLNWRLAYHPSWSSSKWMLALTAGLPLLGLIIFMGSLAIMLPANGGQPGPTVLAGWPNRLFVAAHLAWQVPIAWQALRVGRNDRDLTGQ
jgi:hypothetical protein